MLIGIISMIGMHSRGTRDLLFSHERSLSNTGGYVAHSGHCTIGESRVIAAQLPTNNDPRFRTSARNVPAGSKADSTMHMPWRAPGNAPVSDPCGLAGGTWNAQTLGGDFNATKYAKLGDKGSVVLPYRPTGVKWQRGGVAKPTWYIRANHGGGTSVPLLTRVHSDFFGVTGARLLTPILPAAGYSYRLCKYQPGVQLTEESPTSPLPRRSCPPPPFHAHARSARVFALCVTSLARPTGRVAWVRYP